MEFGRDDATEFERRWERWRIAHNRRRAVVASFIVFGLEPCFALLDYLLSPRSLFHSLVLVRLAMMVATVMLMLAARSRWFERGADLFPSAWIFANAVDITVIITLLGGFRSEYYAGLHLAVVGGGLLFLWPASVVCITHGGIVLAYALTCLATSPASDRFPAGFTHVFFLASVAFLVGLAQVLAYRAARVQLAAQFSLERATGRLESANEQLRQLDRFKSQFFANITHELKTPLAMILSPLELLTSGVDSELAETHRTVLRTMFRNGAKLLKLIDDLLDLSRIEESQLRLRLGDHDLVEWLEALVAQARPLAERKNITVTLASELPAAVIACDPDRMERVFVNLIANAAKFTAEGGHIDVRIRARTDGTGDGIEVEVKDDGVGFAPEHAEKIFERFYQVEMGERRRYGGTGIGLALAREIVELHGGTIRAHGEPGVGATFVVQLRSGRAHFRPEVIERRAIGRDRPDGARGTDNSLTDWVVEIGKRDEVRLLDLAEVTERRIVERDPEEHRHLHTVVAVEDTADILRLITVTLQRDVRVIAVADSRRAFDLVIRERASLVVTDLMMPYVDGLTLTRQLRDDPRTAHLPIVMLTARGDRDDRLAGIETGVDAYLTKPFSPNELLVTVRALLTRREDDVGFMLAQKSDAVQTLAAGLAHQINNPLNYARNSVVRMRRDIEDLLRDPMRADREKLAARIVTMANTADAGLTRIGNTVELLLRYSREGYTRATRSHDLFAAARDVVELVVASAGRNVAASFESEGDGTIECVPEDLNDVLTNLVQNAIEAVPAERPARVAVRGTGDDGRIVVTVEDNGAGMQPEVRQRIFAPFFTTKEPGAGMGLGLAISWRVVRSLGGSIEVESTPGEGTRFRIVLPRRGASRALVAREASGTGARLHDGDSVPGATVA